MESVADRIKKSDKLELDLSNLSLRHFPPEILSDPEFLGLEKINLGGNKLQDLPDEISKFNKLRTLFFAGNDFEQVPKVLGKLPNLFMLSFKGCKVSTVDAEALSPSIQWLILTDNKIKSLPSTVGKLTGLRKVMLSGNQLSSLPDEMKNCRNIELLRLSTNHFTSLPAWLFELPKLSWLAVSGNPITSRDQLSVLEVDIDEFDIKELLGEGTSGKVSKAKWKSKDMDVALKMFKSLSTSDGDPQEEMKASLSVGKHPNTIEVFGKVVHGELPGLILGVITPSYKSLGKPPSFSSVTRDNYEEGTAFTIREVTDILYGIALISAHLHHRGICHGDIYAHNILVDKSDVPSNQKKPALLCDYGAATFYDKKFMNMEPLEVRAWGILADELISLGTKTEDVKSNNEMEAKIELPNLKDLIAKCQSDVILERPSFSVITKTMRDSVCNSLPRVPDTSYDPAFGDIPAAPITLYHLAGVVAIISLIIVAFQKGFRGSSFFGKDACTKKEG